jgi:diaminohydroxyphosphoribosylaminopyrimidine deaminase/5-amino-6-(5-phosphoribosylamino)uracil reductase
VLVGVGTVLADDPRLTARGHSGRDPVRIVADSSLRTPADARLLPARSGSRARVIIATTERAPKARERRLVAAGAEVWRLPARSGRVSLVALARRLGAAGITSVLCEGGAEMDASLIEAGLADELLLYLAPRWISGSARLADAPSFAWSGEPRRIGEDLVVRLWARGRG